MESFANVSGVFVRVLLLSVLLLLSPHASATTYGSQAESYAGCVAVTKQHYETRIVGNDALYYRCTKPTPTASHYVGEVWLRSCDECPYYWANFGPHEWPVLPYAPEKNLGPRTCAAIATHDGNPINVATGNKYQPQSDVALSRLLGFARHYNSYGAFQEYGLGPGWTHSYSRRVEHSAAQNGGVVAKVHAPTGGYVAFYQQQNGSWVAEQNITDTLTQAVDGNGGTTGWTFNDKRNHEAHSYDALGRLVTLTARDGDSLNFTYNNGVIEGAPQDFLLTRVVGRNGRSIALHYDGSDRLYEIVGPAGETYAYGYDAQNLLSAVTYPDGKGLAYRYNEASFTAGTNLPKALTGIIDETGQRFATFKYDSVGRAVSTEHSGAVEKYSIAYGGGTGVVVTNPLGNRQARDFVLQFGVKTATSVLDHCAGCSTVETTYTYDANGHVDQIRDSLAVITDHDQDACGVDAQLVEAKGTTTQRTTQTDWHPDLRVPTQRRIYNEVNTLVAASAWTHNSRGQALTQTQTDPVTSTTRTTASTYCEQVDITAGTCPLLGLLKSINGPRTDVSDIATYTYRMGDDPSCALSLTSCAYRKGDLWKVTNALGHVTETLKYDGAGRVLSVKDANAVITDLEYHPRGWLTARKVRGANLVGEDSDQITRIDYWPTGLVKKVTQPDGAFTSYTYDAAHRLTDITDASGNTIHYTLDNAGNKTQEDTKDAQGTLKRTLSQVYNQLGQLQTQKDAAQQPTGFTYDATGNADTVTDALSRVTDNDYDPLNRLQRTLQDVGGISAETKFQYDALDNLTKVTDPKGLDTSYVYNGLGDLTQLGSPDTGITTYTYDSAGNRKTQVDARSTTATYSYDALNRLIGIAYPTTSLNVGYTYDASQAVCTSGETFAKGRMTKIADGSGTTQYCFDRFGNLVRKVQVSNGITFTLRYGYTLGGQLSRITYPDNLLVDYVRDGQGRVTEVGVTPSGGARQVLVRGATYAPFGPVTGWTYGNGRIMQRTLNQNYQPNTIDGGPGGLSLGYGFDPVGNLTTLRTALQTDPPVATYVYDRLNRLSDVKDGPAGTVLEHYGYDATGNRLSVTAAGATTAYTYPTTNHRLGQVGTVARSYDAIGNTTQIGGTAKQFVYNDLGRMSQVKAGATVTMNYLYNGKGEQVRKYLGTANTYTLYDEAGHWLGDYDTTGAPVQQIVWLDDLPVGVIVGATTGQKLHYIEPDHLGTPRVVIDPVRNVAVWKWELQGEAFGNTVPNQNPDNDANQFVFNMRFPGQRYDAASGLNYNYFRDYDPSRGGYIQSDPIGVAGGLATYGYSASSPLVAYDRYGLCWSNARAVGHYYGGGGRTVSLDEIGCTSIVSGRVQPERNIWIARTKAAARAAAASMDCGAWKRININRSVGVGSGIFWIGGFSLQQSSNCIVQRFCPGGDNGVQCVTQNSYSFDCLLTSRMHDLFENPSDLDNSANGANPDFWDRYSYGGSKFYLDGNWSDSVKGSGSL